MSDPESKIGAVELLPCPFCGLQPTEEHISEGMGEFWVLCPDHINCAGSPGTSGTKERAIKKWNRRAPLTLGQGDAPKELNRDEVVQNLAKHIFFIVHALRHGTMLMGTVPSFDATATRMELLSDKAMIYLKELGLSNPFKFPPISTQPAPLDDEISDKEHIKALELEIDILRRLVKGRIDEILKSRTKPAPLDEGSRKYIRDLKSQLASAKCKIMDWEATYKRLEAKIASGPQLAESAGKPIDGPLGQGDAPKELNRDEVVQNLAKHIFFIVHALRHGTMLMGTVPSFDATATRMELLSDKAMIYLKELGLSNPFKFPPISTQPAPLDEGKWIDPQPELRHNDPGCGASICEGTHTYQCDCKCHGAPQPETQRDKCQGVHCFTPSMIVRDKDGKIMAYQGQAAEIKHCPGCLEAFKKAGVEVPNGEA